MFWKSQTGYQFMLLTVRLYTSNAYYLSDKGLIFFKLIDLKFY